MFAIHRWNYLIMQRIPFGCTRSKCVNVCVRVAGKETRHQNFRFCPLSKLVYCIQYNVCAVYTIRLNKYKKRHIFVLTIHVRIYTWQQRQQQCINNVWSSDEMAYNLTKTTNLTVGETQSTKHRKKARERHKKRARDKQTNS